MNPFLPYVQSLKESFLAVKGTTASGHRSILESPSKALIFSPHPDDECIIGLLPLRMKNELGIQVVNVPVTFGSHLPRRAERAEELTNACNYLGWHLHQERSSLEPLEVTDIVKILTEYQPEVIFFPHDQDWNSRHISTNRLLLDALQLMPKSFSCHVINTEYWGAMTNPNLMIEAEDEDLATLIAATSLHIGEVERNPYHLSLPFWMQDNVRRGSELVSGQGGTASTFTFATLYRIHRWQNGELIAYTEKARTVPTGANNLQQLFSPWK